MSRVIARIAFVIALASSSSANAGPAESDSVAAAAREAYANGLKCLNRYDVAGPEESITHFRRAIELDSTCAPAYAGLAQAYYNLVEVGRLAADEFIPQVKSAALMAVALDESCVDAHLSMFQVYSHEWSFVDAEREVHRALQLAPEHPSAHDFHAMHLLNVGRFDDAIAASRHFVALDSISGLSRWHLPYCLFRAGRLNEALPPLEEMRQDVPIVELLLVWIYGMKGMHDEAAIACERVQSSPVIASDPAVLSAVGWAHGLAGRRDEATEVLDRLQQMSRKRSVDPVAFALVHVGLGDHDAALVWLRRAVETHAPSSIRLKSMPMLEPLYDDARFRELVWIVGFP